MLVVVMLLKMKVYYQYIHDVLMYLVMVWILKYIIIIQYIKADFTLRHLLS